MDPSPTHRDAWVEVDLGAIVANTTALRSLLPPRTDLMAVIKADAYGHGAVAVARALQDARCAGTFGVATLDEGLALRASGIAGRIVILYDIPASGIGDARMARLECSAGSLEALRELLAGAPPDDDRWIHLKLDTGMTRQGLRPQDLEAPANDLGPAAPMVAGIWTHLRDGADADGSTVQRAAFADAVGALARHGLRAERHVSASAAILSRSVADEDLVRPGLSLYGAQPQEFTSGGGSMPVALRAAMSVRARSIRVVEVPAGTPVGYGGSHVTAAAARLATLPLGYADGIPRNLGDGRGQALVRGQMAPIIGRISMDSLVVDVTEVAAATRGDTFTLLGSDGHASITLEAMAATAGTIPQEAAVRLAARLPRIYC